MKFAAKAWRETRAYKNDNGPADNSAGYRYHAKFLRRDETQPQIRYLYGGTADRMQPARVAAFAVTAERSTGRRPVCGESDPHQLAAMPFGCHGKNVTTKIATGVATIELANGFFRDSFVAVKNNAPHHFESRDVAACYRLGINPLPRMRECGLQVDFFRDYNQLFNLPEKSFGHYEIMIVPGVGYIVKN